MKKVKNDSCLANKVNKMKKKIVGLNFLSGCIAHQMMFWYWKNTHMVYGLGFRV